MRFYEDEGSILQWWSFQRKLSEQHLVTMYALREGRDIEPIRVYPWQQHED